jgi:ATP-dependent protease HslVU (ClpYQ) peptidase subunit
MTAVVGVVDEGVVTIGGDTCASREGGDRFSLQDTKVWRLGPALIGIAGDSRMGDLIQFGLAWPKPKRFRKVRRDAREVLVRELVPAIQGLLKAHSAGAIRDNQQLTGTDLLVGVWGRLFLLQPDFSVMEPRDPYFAIGAGSSYALGALYTMRQRTGFSDLKVRSALEAATAYHGTVNGEYTILSTVE